MKRFPIKTRDCRIFCWHCQLNSKTSGSFFILSEDRIRNLIPVSHEDEGGDAVKDRHHEVSQGEVHQEVVRHTPHRPMG